MRYVILLAVGLSAVASPALAQDGSVYVGIEGGVSFPRSTDYDVSATRVQTVPTGSGLLGQTVTTTNTVYNPGFNAEYKNALDVDEIAGYDFGFFRLEGQLGYQRTTVRNFTASSLLVANTNTAPISGVTSNSFASGSRTTVLSGMVDALLDYNVTPRLRLYAGGGGGRARVKTLGDRDYVWAYQSIAGIAASIGPNLELGVKYRYFLTDHLNLNGRTSFANAATGATSVSQFSDSGRYRSNSVLASLIYNFGHGRR